MFLDIEYPWKNILSEQLHNATYKTEHFNNAYFIIFSIAATCRTITDIPRVPLSVVVEFGCANTAAEIRFNSSCISFSNVNPSPVECNLHFLDGYLKEIEVYTLDGTPLQLESICEGKKYYLFH